MKRLRVQRIDTVGFVDKGDNPPAFLTFFKRAPEEKPVTDKSDIEEGHRVLSQLLGWFKRAEKVAVDDKLAKRVERAGDKWAAFNDAGEKVGEFDTEEAARAAAYGKQEKREMPEQDKTPEAVTKAVEEMQKKLDDLTKRAETAEADAKANAEKVEKLAEEKRIATYIAKAETFKSLPIKAAEFGPLMAKLAKALTTEEFAEIERVLAAANESARVGKLTEELGSGAPEGSAAAKVQAEVAKMKQTDPSLSDELARGKVFKANPTLRRELEAEQAGR